MKVSKIRGTNLARVTLDISYKEVEIASNFNPDSLVMTNDENIVTYGIFLGTEEYLGRLGLTIPTVCCEDCYEEKIELTVTCDHANEIAWNSALASATKELPKVQEQIKKAVEDYSKIEESIEVL